MTKNEIEHAVFETIADFFSVDAAAVTRETVAADVPGWDSVSNMPMILEVEDRLEIELPLRALGALGNVGELADLCDSIVNPR